MFLKPIKCKKKYEDIIASKIIVWLWVNFYQECFRILKSGTVLNDSNIIREAIMSGKIQYENGAFKGKFTNAISAELEKLGARYSKYQKAYLIAKESLPTNILWAIDTAKALAFAKSNAITKYLLAQLAKIDKLVQKLVFSEAVNSIMKNLQDRVYKNARQHKIELITPKLDDFMQDEIAKRYTNNLNFWIKNFVTEKIPEMRSEVAKLAIKGASTKTIAEYINKEFGIDQRHAKFLARNESAIATSSYLAAKYTSEGFTHFKWHTIVDGRERDLHRELGKPENNKYGINGKNIFRFDEPPIIDERTGQRGLPSQTYNCRCSFAPVITKEFLENRRKMFKANNSIVEKIKSLWNNKKCG